MTRPASLRCRCGYLLHGLTEKRCPECGRPFPKYAIRTWPYLWRGFLIWFSVVAILTIASAPFVFRAANSGDEIWFPPLTIFNLAVFSTVVFIISGLAIAVGTGLIGMLLGYFVYRTRR